jgi:hypothetical protein
MIDSAKRFRRIYVAESIPGADFSPLLTHSDKIIYITNGFEKYDEIQFIISKCLEDFDPVQDAFIPVGRSLTNVICGAVLSKKGECSYGIYSKQSYRFKTF